METVSSCSSCSTTKGVDRCFITVYLLGQNPVSARETESKGCGEEPPSCCVCLVWYNQFRENSEPFCQRWPLLTSAPNLHFRAVSPPAGERVSAGQPWECLSISKALSKLSQFLCTHAPLALAPSCHGGDPGPCGLHHPPQNSFSCVSSILEWIWGRGSLVSRRPHSRCSFQISKAPRGHTPHLLCHLCVWPEPPPPWHSPPAPSRRAPALSWHSFPGSRLQAAQSPVALYICPSRHMQDAKGMSRPPEQVVFQVSWSAGFFSLSEHPHLE